MLRKLRPHTPTAGNWAPLNEALTCYTSLVPLHLDEVPQEALHFTHKYHNINAPVACDALLRLQSPSLPTIWWIAPRED